MPLREDILAPIPGDNPSGIDLRYDNKLLIYDKIREARRKDDELGQGAWQTERKLANYPLVVRLAQDALATVSKDLQVAAWLSEALLYTEHFAGLERGLTLCHKLLDTFWDTVHPAIEDGDLELRAAPLEWVGSFLVFPLKSVPLTNSGHSWFVYTDALRFGPDDPSRPEKDRKTRAREIELGKIPIEIVDKAFNDTPKVFYATAEKSLDGCIAALKALEAYCDEKFGDDAPSFGKLRDGLADVRQTVHTLLNKKREHEPDPVVEEPPPIEAVAAPEVHAETSETAMVAAPVAYATVVASEPTDVRQASASIAAAAHFLRKRDPLSPAPYLILRGLRWGELRAAPRLSDSLLLEAPPTELRQRVKRLALGKRWPELLDACEDAMALPCSRAWLDLQRLAVAACSALGADYQPIANAIQSELRALLNDLPELLDITLLDDTPAANPETKAWLEHLQTPVRFATAPLEAAETPAGAALNGHANSSTTWLAQSADPFVLAKEALAARQEEKAFSIMRAEIARQRSGRGRFRRTMQLIELATSAGKDAIAQPLLEDMAAMIETHKLDAWEEPEVVAGDLLRLLRSSKKIQGNAGEKQKMFERICRLDPVQALTVG